MLVAGVVVLQLWLCCALERLFTCSCQSMYLAGVSGAVQYAAECALQIGVLSCPAAAAALMSQPMASAMPCNMGEDEAVMRVLNACFEASLCMRSCQKGHMCCIRRHKLGSLLRSCG